MSIIPLRSDAITMYIRDKSAKHKTYEDEKGIMKRYVRTRNFISKIKEQTRWASPCAIIWSRPNLTKIKRHQIEEEEGKRHSYEEHYHSHTYK